MQVQPDRHRSSVVAQEQLHAFAWLSGSNDQQKNRLQEAVSGC
ncbi:hypothetical protein [Alkalicoccus luteus]|nr:hypothetical protein [Alkalicoccus luteus]